MADTETTTPRDTKKRAASFKTKLVRLIAQNGTSSFTAPMEPYARSRSPVPRDDAPGGRAFSDYLSRGYHNSKEIVVGGSDLKDAIP